MKINEVKKMNQKLPETFEKLENNMNLSGHVDGWVHFCLTNALG